VKRILTTALAATLLCLTAGLSAQESDKAVSVKSVKRLNRAPVSHEVLQVKLPRPTEHKLSNGLTVLLLERHKLPTLNLSLWFDSSSLDDPKDLPGLSDFTADMLREGTARRTSKQLAQEVDSLGATLHANSEYGASVTTVTASGFVEDADKILDLMSDVILHPAFPADELDKYKKRQLASLEEERSDPGFLGEERLYRALYGSHPASVTSPTPESVKAVTPELLKQFHAQHYAPNFALLGVVGDFDSKAMLALLEKYFGTWKPSTAKPAKVADVPPPSAPKIALVDRSDSVQTNILAAFMAPPRRSPEYFPLRVMNRILGEGATGRLFLDLREEKSYTYGAYSGYYPDTYPRPLAANTEVRTNVTEPAFHDLLDEFRRMREEPVSDEELDDARRGIVASFALSLERSAQLLDMWLRARHMQLGDDYWDNFPTQINKITAADVQRVAKTYLDPKHMQAVCVGNRKEIETGLKKFGAVEFYDADGKKLDK
jgi:predicted Zn-dependent peptidase